MAKKRSIQAQETSASTFKKKDNKRLRIQLMYIGVKYSMDGKKFHVYQPLKDGRLDAEQDACWYTKKLKYGAPGSMISIDAEPSEDGRGYGSVYPGSAEFERIYKDDELVARLRAESDARETARKAVSARKKAASRNLIKERLDPIKEAYQKMGWRERQALLANVMEYITRRI